MALEEGREIAPLLLEVFEVSSETTVITNVLIDAVKVRVASQIEHGGKLLKLFGSEIAAWLIGGLDSEDLVKIVAHVSKGVTFEEWAWNDLLGTVQVAVGVLRHGLELLHLSLNGGWVLGETAISALNPESSTSFLAESRRDVLKDLRVDGSGIIGTVFEDL